ncbi:MAG: magnesium-translocating P-type ATPase, partial [Bacteroidota bacterium]
MHELHTSRGGLSMQDAAERLNDIRARQGKPRDISGWVAFLSDTLRNPLILRLLSLFVVSAITGDIVADSMIAAMIIIGSVIRYVQEVRSERAVEALQKLVRATVTVIRQGAEHSIPIEDLVPGDIVRLSAGDLIPADLCLLESDDLHVDQHILTGESL